MTTTVLAILIIVIAFGWVAAILIFPQKLAPSVQIVVALVLLSLSVLLLVWSVWMRESLAIEVREQPQQQRQQR